MPCAAPGDGSSLGSRGTRVTTGEGHRGMAVRKPDQGAVRSAECIGKVTARRPAQPRPW